MAQALSTAVQGIMGVVQPIAKIAQPLIQGFGLVSNLIQGNRAAGLQTSAINNVNQLSALANNPAALNARIQALQQPLNRGLLSGVGNDVQGFLMERGLGVSPALMSQYMGQALAPYQQKSQELAIQEAFAPYRDLGYLTEAASRTGPGIANTTGLWNTLAGLPATGGRPQVAPGPPGSEPGLTGSAYPQPIPGGTDPTAPGIQFPTSPLPEYGTLFPGVSTNPYDLGQSPPFTDFPGAADFSFGGNP